MDSILSLSAVFEPVRQPIIVTGEGKVIFANIAALGAFGKDVTETPPDQLFPPEMLSNTAERLMCSVELLGKRAKVLAIRRGSNRIFYLDPEPDEAASGIMITSHMSSYLRNCVTGLKIAADRCFSQLETGGAPDPRLVSILYHYYYRLARSITQIDSADKLCRREFSFRPAPMDLSEVCQTFIETLSSLTSDRGVKINFTAEPGRLIAFADSSLVEMLLLNLFSNCLKNCSPGDEISLDLSRDPGKIALSLGDTGQGIPENELSEIFSLPTNNSVFLHEGIGLGLFISHEIVRLHGGTLLIESREGEGVHIRVLLPTGDESTGVLNSPRAEYSTGGMSLFLTGLADAIPSSHYGLKFED
ncbi:MAG: HAMP domain-containing histidine kinase [Oscillospiraceae bacterium]|jgi:signal transduction histidine kinase|nr:HAMP domain-containing histidine kinase [Oscillospiraceae bacterium]